MARPAIRIANLAKSYSVYDQQFDFLKELLTGRVYHREKRVLQDINLDIAHGEIVGIIGRNGAGKSTLLKIISGTLSPTVGSVNVEGRVSAILELGTGFNSNYSGRDNVIISALMRGMSEAEVNAKFDGIVDFAGLAEVIDEPFHTYSSGMQARLAFAAAVSVDADVIIIDEALAAGDIRFVNRSLRKIHDICKSGVTALFVTHTTYQVMQLCSRAIWIDEGRVRMDGDPVEVVRAYEYDMHEAIAKDRGLHGAGVTSIESSNNDHVAAFSAPKEVESATIDLLETVTPSEPDPDGGTVPASTDEATTQADEGAAAVAGAADTVVGQDDTTELEAIAEPNATAELGHPRELDSAVATDASIEIDEAAGADSALAADPVAELKEARQAVPDSPKGTLEIVSNNDELAMVETRARAKAFSTDQYRIVKIEFKDARGQQTQTFRFGEKMFLSVSYECLMSELPPYSCGLAVAFNRLSDFEAVMYFNTNYPHSDDELRNYFQASFRQDIARSGTIEAHIDPIQLRAGEYYVSLGILPNQPGMHEFYEYLHCQYRVVILPNGFEEPSVFYPMVTWKHEPAA